MIGGARFGATELHARFGFDRELTILDLGGRGEDILFTYADGWDLNELHENIREAIREHCIVFDGESEVQNERESD